MDSRFRGNDKSDTLFLETALGLKTEGGFEFDQRDKVC